MFMCHMITIKHRDYASQQMVFVMERSVFCAAEADVLNSLHTKVFTSVCYGLGQFTKPQYATLSGE